MPRGLPPFAENWRDRHGKPRIYFRRGKGSRIPLPDKIGSHEYIAAYHTRDADQRRLATAAISRLEAHRPNIPAQTMSPSLGKS
jgi:enterobacteria phage integrase